MNAPPDAPLRILVVQATRMGDVLQTSPLVRALKRIHPGAHITVMLRRMGEPIAKRHPDIDDIIVYDEDKMFFNLRAHDSDKLLRAYEQAVEYIERIKKARFDVAYNCTQSIGSAMLLRLAGLPQVVGAHLSADWQFVLRGGWTNYLFTSLYHRRYSDINLCDIFRHLVDDSPDSPMPADAVESRSLVFEVRDEDRRAAAALLAEHGVEAGDALVCFQLGASENQKRWPEHRFAALARLIADRYDVRIALLGVQDEAHYGQAFLQHYSGPVASLFGKTSIPVLAAVLERARLLVTNDTGTMHIAAAVNCPVALISVGTVHFRETGPYGSGHCAIERRMLRAELRDASHAALPPQETVRPEQAFDLARRTLDGHLGGRSDSCAPRPESVVPDLDALADVVMYRSEFASDGCLEWYPVIARAITETDMVRMAYRAMWLSFLRGSRPKADPSHDMPENEAERLSISRMLDCFLSSGGAAMREWADSVGAQFMGLAALAIQGAAITERLIEHLQKGSVVQGRKLVADLVRLDEKTRLYGEVHAVVRPLTAIARFERDNLEGSNVLSLAQTTLAIYNDLSARSRLMAAKLEMIARIWRERCP